MKRWTAVRAVIFIAVLTTVGVNALAQQASGVQAQGRAASQASVADTATLKRLCNDLGRFQGKLQQIKGTLTEIEKIHNQFKLVLTKIKQEKLTPVFEKAPLAQQTTKTQAAQTNNLFPADKIKGQTTAIGQLQKINGDMKHLKEKLNLQKMDIQRQWQGMESGFQGANAGSMPVSQNRACTASAARAVDQELADLQSRAGSLKSQIDDLRSQLDQQYGQGSCIPAQCGTFDCSGCCAWQNKITAAEGTLQRRIQEAERNSCILNCQRAEFACAFNDFDQKTNSWFGLLAELIKLINEMRSSAIRNMM